MKQTPFRALAPLLLILSSVILAACAGGAPTFLTSTVRMNFGAEPTFGSYILRSGFTPDPQTLDLQAGGHDSIQIQGTRGFVQSSQPDLSITYTAGRYAHLYFWVDGCVDDTVLFIRGPESGWYADDDAGPGLGGGVGVTIPPSGRYDIWVGTFADNGYRPNCRLYISELRPTNWD